MPKETPTEAMAAAAATRVMGWRAPEVRRFPNGAAHYVYEVRTADAAPIVVRMGLEADRGEMACGLVLVEQLRALGVPLPKILADGTHQPLPWVAMERLPGTDLGQVIGKLADGQLRSIARNVTEAQHDARRYGSAGRYGYAATAGSAPYDRWSAVTEARLDRSRRRILAAGLFAPKVIAPVADLLARHRAELDRLPAVPFLHDTTTRNVIVTDDGHFSGIVDVDDLCFGDPRFAPALTLAVLMMNGWPVAYVSSWMHAAGHADDRVFRVYVALFILDLMSEHGQSFNGNEGPTTAAARERLLEVFARAIEDARAA